MQTFANQKQQEKIRKVSSVCLLITMFACVEKNKNA